MLHVRQFTHSSYTCSAVSLLLLQTEHRKRERARKAAVKPAVEYDEDGHVKVSVGI